MTLGPFQPPTQCAGYDSCGIILVFNLASASVHGCYLYIIIHYSMSQRDWGMRSVPRGGRPDEEFFLKAIDTFTYIKNCTNSPYVLKMHYDCAYEGWVLAIILVE